jgi:hypothetical protein
MESARVLLVLMSAMARCLALAVIAPALPGLLVQKFPASARAHY